MIRSDKFVQMLNMQARLNDLTNGDEWMSGRTKEGRIIRWDLALMLEGVELLDSLNWKHWKDINGEHDIDNAKMELVDMWHFFLSMCYDDDVKLNDLKVVIDSFVDKDLILTKESIITHLTKHTQSLFEVVCNTDKIICRKHIIMYELLMLGNGLKMNFDEVFKLYLGKNVLNIFRTNNGYKEGTYVKIWNDKEDNVILKEMLDSGISNETELMEELQLRYDNLAA